MSKSPDAFRTISEVAEWLGVQAHVLRFWESKFSQVKPVKRAGGRRYYRPADMLLLGGIKRLLHDDGLTIKGVQKILREQGVAHVSDLSKPLDDMTVADLDGELVEASEAAEDVAAEPAPIEEAVLVDDEPQAAVEAGATDESSGSEDAPAEQPSLDLEPEPPEEAEPGTADAASTEADTPSDEDTSEEFAALSEDPFAAETAETANGEDAGAAALPSFLHRPSKVEEEATDDDNADPVEEDAAPAMFRRRSRDSEDAEVTGASDAATASEDASEPPASVDDAVDAKDTPKPRIIEIVEVPDVATIDATPHSLTMATRAISLKGAPVEEIIPLVAQLAALRDRMATARKSGRKA